MEVISVKYEDKINPKTFTGKSYKYYTTVDVNVGDFVIAPTVGGDRIARVSEINIPEEKIEDIKPYLKTIEHKIDRENYLKFTKSMLKLVYMANLKGNDVANILIPKLVEKKFIVHRYNSHSTSSIYLKLDYGLSCGIRIADHDGKKKYHYRFNVLKDYKGDKVVNRDNLVSYFFNYDELDELLALVEKERQEKIRKYGLGNYKRYMQKESQDELYTRFKRIKEAC